MVPPPPVYHFITISLVVVELSHTHFLSTARLCWWKCLKNLCLKKIVKTKALLAVEHIQEENLDSEAC